MRKREKLKMNRRRQVVASEVPDRPKPVKKIPDFQARLRKIYGDKVLSVSGAELLSADRDRY